MEVEFGRENDRKNPLRRRRDGQIKALITIAGNPVLSNPNGRRLDRALEQLEFAIAVDFYVNETTRHADIVPAGDDAQRRSLRDTIGRGRGSALRGGMRGRA